MALPKLIKQPRTSDEPFEVKSSKLYSNNKPHPDGLISEQGFGPIHDYKCWCRYWGPSQCSDENYIVRCSKCNIEITTSNIRRQKWGIIKLNVPIIHPLLILLLMTESFFRDIKIDLVARGVLGIGYDSEDKAIIDKKNDAVDHVELEQILLNIAKDYNISTITKFFDHYNSLLIDHVDVLPPDYRPVVGKKIDILNSKYATIINYNDTIGELEDILPDATLVGHLFSLVYELYIEIIHRFAHKEGLIRKHILGKRIDFSGRSVIIPDPYALDTVKLPLKIVKELYKLPVARLLVNRGKAASYIDAIELIDRDPESIIDEFKEVMADNTILLNRQPTLHRSGIIGFKPDVEIGSDAIRIPAVICGPVGGDFDGDTVYSDVTLIVNGKEYKNCSLEFLRSKIL